MDFNVTAHKHNMCRYACRREKLIKRVIIHMVEEVSFVSLLTVFLVLEMEYWLMDS